MAVKKKVKKKVVKKKAKPKASQGESQTAENVCGDCSGFEKKPGVSGRGDCVCEESPCHGGVVGASSIACDNFSK